MSSKTPTARILRGVAGVYLLDNPDSGFHDWAVPRGLFRKQGLKPLPGDLVNYEPSGDPDIPYVINRILERKNVLQRPPAANIDLLLITSAAVVPKTDYFFIDRMLAYAVKNHIEPALILNKGDLEGATEEKRRFLDNYLPSGFPLFFTAKDQEPEELKKAIAGKFAVFCGKSGVGKSSLMNRLLGRTLLETGSLNERGKHGRQTTRSIELYAFEGAWLADTPGFQSLDAQLLGMTGTDLVLAYPEMAEAATHCRYRDCRHLGEEGCAVDTANMLPERLERYRQLRRELDALKPRY